MRIIIAEPLRKRFSESQQGFNEVMQLQGTIYREIESRKTLRFEHQNKGYFAKLHFGVGWGEIIRDFLHFKIPVLGAKTEYQAIKLLEKLNITTMKVVGYGLRGWNPAKQESFLITEEICDKVGMNDFCAQWPMNPPLYKTRIAIVTKLAQVLRTMHTHGLNHRDCYLCHFYIDPKASENIDIAVMDLHRAQMRKRTPKRWLIKDLSGLLFSALDIGLSRKDLLRFLKIYTQASLKKALLDEKNFWQEVQQRAIKMYYREFAKQPKFFTNP